MSETDTRIRLHVQNPPSPEKAPPGYPVRKSNPAFAITRAQYDEACRRHPDVAAAVDVSFGETREEYEAGMADAQVIVATTQQLLEQAPVSGPELRWAMVTSASFHKLLPISGWLKPDALLVHSSGIHARKAGEFVAASLLMLNCRIPFFATAKEERRWTPQIETGIEGKTLVVIGVGHVGGAGAARARGLGMHVIGVRRSGEPHEACHETVGPGELEGSLRRADFVLVALPSTAETRGSIDRSVFATMKEGAGLVATAPTPVFDFDALAEALTSGHLSGAVLDNFEPEPVPPESPWWTLPNLVITPHTSCIDRDQYSPLTLDLLFDNLRADLAGDPLPTRANIERGY